MTTTALPSAWSKYWSRDFEIRGDPPVWGVSGVSACWEQVPSWTDVLIDLRSRESRARDPFPSAEEWTRAEVVEIGEGWQVRWLPFPAPRPEGQRWGPSTVCCYVGFTALDGFGFCVALQESNAPVGEVSGIRQARRLFPTMRTLFGIESTGRMSLSPTGLAQGRRFEGGYCLDVLRAAVTNPSRWLGTDRHPYTLTRPDLTRVLEWSTVGLTTAAESVRFEEIGLSPTTWAQWRLHFPNETEMLQWREAVPHDTAAWRKATRWRDAGFSSTEVPSWIEAARTWRPDPTAEVVALLGRYREQGWTPQDWTPLTSEVIALHVSVCGECKQPCSTTQAAATRARCAGSDLERLLTDYADLLFVTDRERRDAYFRARTVNAASLAEIRAWEASTSQRPSADQIRLLAVLV